MKKYRVSANLDNSVILTNFTNEKTQQNGNYQECRCNAAIYNMSPDGVNNSNDSSTCLQRRQYSKNDVGGAVGSCTSLQPTLRRQLTNICSLKMLQKRVPITAWLPTYNASAAVSDVIAGVTVGLMVIPQAIAYSNIAGMPAQIGLYSTLMACFMYVIFGSVKDCAMGPTAIAALLVRQNNHGYGIEGTVLLCFITGCVQLLMGVLQMGFLIDFISGPVSIGFTSAIALVIATTQVKDILGLNFSAEGFLTVWEKLFEHIRYTSVYDASLGFICITVLLLLRKTKDIHIGPHNDKERKLHHNILIKTIWFISTGRNIIVVVISATVAFLLEFYGSRQLFVLTGDVKSGLPNVALPPFTVHVGNSSYAFTEVISSIGSGLVVVPLLGILENIALAKVFADGKAIDATQEMLAMGVCNIAGSFLSSMPAAGALSRGGVNNASGVRTPLGSLYTGIIVILALSFFTPCFYYIPKAALAAIIIAAVAFMVEFHVLKPIWKTKKSDLIPAIATFVCCLFIKLEIGIAIGIGLNLLSLLYASARPSVIVEKLTSISNCDYLLVTPDRSLAFPSVEYVRSVVSKAGVKLGASSLPVVVDAKHIQGADFTVAKGIKCLIEDFVNRKQPILFFNLKESVIAVLQGVQPKNLIVCKTYEELDDVLKKVCNTTIINQDISNINHM